MQKPQILMFSEKGLMDKNKEKMEFWKGRQKENQKKQNVKKTYFKDRPSGDTKKNL